MGSRVSEKDKFGNEDVSAPVISLCFPGLKMTFKKLDIFFFSSVQGSELTLDSILLTAIYTEMIPGVTHFI